MSTAMLSSRQHDAGMTPAQQRKRPLSIIEEYDSDPDDVIDGSKDAKRTELLGKIDTPSHNNEPTLARESVVSRSTKTTQQNHLDTRIYTSVSKLVRTFSQPPTDPLPKPKPEPLSPTHKSVSEIITSPVFNGVNSPSARSKPPEIKPCHCTRRTALVPESATSDSHSPKTGSFTVKKSQRISPELTLSSEHFNGSSNTPDSDKIKENLSVSENSSQHPSTDGDALNVTLEAAQELHPTSSSSHVPSLSITTCDVRPDIPKNTITVAACTSSSLQTYPEKSASTKHNSSEAEATNTSSTSSNTQFSTSVDSVPLILVSSANDSFSDQSVFSLDHPHETSDDSNDLDNDSGENTIKQEILLNILNSSVANISPTPSPRLSPKYAFTNSTKSVLMQKSNCEHISSLTCGAKSKGISDFAPKEGLATSSSSDLKRLQETTERLRLSTRRPSVMQWRQQYLEGAGFPLKRPSLTGEAADERLTSDRKQRINDALEWLRNELMEMRSQDQLLARQLLTIKNDIHQLKLRRSTEEHQDLLDDFHAEMEEMQEFSDVLDIPLPPNLGGNPLKHIGITRLNMSARRFSAS